MPKPPQNSYTESEVQLPKPTEFDPSDYQGKWGIGVDVSDGRAKYILYNDYQEWELVGYEIKATNDQPTQLA